MAPSKPHLTRLSLASGCSASGISAAARRGHASGGASSACRAERRAQVTAGSQRLRKLSAGELQNCAWQSGGWPAQSRHDAPNMPPESASMMANTIMHGPAASAASVEGASAETERPRELAAVASKASADSSAKRRRRCRPARRPAMPPKMSCARGASCHTAATAAKSAAGLPLHALRDTRRVCAFVQSRCQAKERAGVAAAHRENCIYWYLQ